MSTAAHLEPAWSGGSALEAVRSARAALADAAPSRLWALSEPEVAEAMGLLGELVASVSALMVGVLAEAKTRSLGAGGVGGRWTGRGPALHSCRCGR